MWWDPQFSGSLLDRLRELAGPVAFNIHVEVLDLDQKAVAEAIAADSVAPLLRRHPELLDTTGMMVAACPASSRRTVQRFLRPLRDVVLVAAHEELRSAVLEVPAPPVATRHG